MAYYCYVGMGNDNMFKISTVFGNFSGNFGKTIKIGDGDLQTEAESIVSVVTETGQAVADSIKSKNDKEKKDNKK